MRLLFFSFCFSGMLSTSNLSAQSPVAIGRKAPGFNVGVLNSTQSFILDSTSRDKIVVIEFWATWCSPCIKAFPHLNELANKFEKEDVIFLSVTYENNLEKIRSTLINNPLNTIIGLDRDLQMFKNYGAWAIPQTLIIDRGRNLFVSIHPDKLTAQIIQDVLDGKKVDIPDNGKQTYFDPKGAEEYFRSLEKQGKN